MGKIRVLQFITPAGFYGAERWVIALANNIDHEKVVCELVVSHESETQDLSVAKHYPTEAGAVHYLPMRGRFDWQAISLLAKLIRERRIDIIHTHGYKSDIIGLLAARKAGIKCVSTPHGFSGNVGFKLATFIRIGTFMLRYFDLVVPLSEELVEDMRRLGVPETKTYFIRNGVDLKEVDASLQVLEGRSVATKSERVIGFIGQMIPRKGISHLLHAFDQLHRGDHSLRLQLLGDGAQRSELEQIAAGLDSHQAIQFLGFRSDRLELLANFSLFVMTSSLEGIPRCMMEAMAVGIPVVAFDILGIDQLIEHEVTGLLAPLGDDAALAECCLRVLSDPTLAEKLIRNARQKIDDLYSARRMASEYESLFGQLCRRS